MWAIIVRVNQGYDWVYESRLYRLSGLGILLCSWVARRSNVLRDNSILNCCACGFRFKRDSLTKKFGNRQG